MLEMENGGATVVVLVVPGVDVLVVPGVDVLVVLGVDVLVVLGVDVLVDVGAIDVLVVPGVDVLVVPGVDVLVVPGVDVLVVPGLVVLVVPGVDVLVVDVLVVPGVDVEVVDVLVVPGVDVLVDVGAIVVEVVDVLVDVGAIVVLDVDVLVDVGAIVVLDVDVLVDVGAMVVLVGAAVVVVLAATAVTPQITCPKKRSPTAVGPVAIWWPAFTVIEPSGFVICSLKMYVNVSPTLRRMPVNIVLGAGFIGTGTITSGWAAVPSPSSVRSVPPVMVVEPDLPDSEAVQVLVTLEAVNTSAPEVFRVLISAELVTDPPAGVPWVLTVIGPEVKKMPGPYRASPEGTLAVTGVAEPPGGNVTVGRNCGSPHPTVFDGTLGGGFAQGRSAAGPPNRLIRLE